ncbi:hypothetical protein D3C81_2256870 [compost metagenome]
MFDGKTRQHRVAVVPFRVDRVAAIGIVAPHGISQKFVVGGVRPVLDVQWMNIVRAHHFLQADDIRADGTYRVTQLG